MESLEFIFGAEHLALALDAQQLHVEDERGATRDLGRRAVVAVAHARGDRQPALLTATQQKMSALVKAKADCAAAYGSFDNKRRNDVPDAHVYQTAQDSNTTHVDKTAAFRQNMSDDDIPKTTHPWSHPLMTRPWPSGNSKGWLRSRLESNLEPSLRSVPV